MLADAAYIGNRSSWKVSLAVGAAFFVVFFWLVPAWLGSRLEATESSTLRPAMEALIGRRLHWFKWLGVAIALVFGYFALRNYIQAGRHARDGERNTSLIARLLARLLS